MLSLIFSVVLLFGPIVLLSGVTLTALTLALTAYFIINIKNCNMSFMCYYTVLGKGDKDILFRCIGKLFYLSSVFAHATSLIFVPAFLIYSFFSVMRYDKKNFILFVAILSIVLFFVGLVNYARFGFLWNLDMDISLLW